MTTGQNGDRISLFRKVQTLMRKGESTDDEKKIRLLLAAGAAAAALTACTRADTDNGGMAGSAAPSQAQSAANTDSQGTEAAETSPAQDLSVTGGTEGGDTLNGLTEETGAAGGQTELAQEPAQESETMGTEEAAASPEAGDRAGNPFGRGELFR